MNSATIAMPHRGVNSGWMNELELLEVKVYPLPGGAVRRSSLGVDTRLAIQSPKSSDIITFYEHVASIRHKPTMKIYVAFRETMDALLRQQNDPTKYPKWLMDHPVKRTELRIFIHEAFANPKQYIATLGMAEEWHDRWLRPLLDDTVHETLSYYMLINGIVKQEMFAKR